MILRTIPIDYDGKGFLSSVSNVLKIAQYFAYQAVLKLPQECVHDKAKSKKENFKSCFMLSCIISKAGKKETEKEMIYNLINQKTSNS